MITNNIYTRCVNIYHGEPVMYEDRLSVGCLDISVIGVCLAVKHRLVNKSWLAVKHGLVKKHKVSCKI